MRNKFPDNVCNITEKDFWASIRVPANACDAGHLKAAIKLGRAGKKARAYAELIEWHRASLADEWQQAQRSFEGAAPPPAKALRDLLNHKVTCWHNLVVRFGKRIDWSAPELPRSALCGFHYMGWLQPAVQALGTTGQKRYRDFLLDVLLQYYRSARHQPRYDAIGIHPVYYSLGASAKTMRFVPLYIQLINTGRMPAPAAEACMKLFLGFGRALQMQLRRFIAHNIITAESRSLLQLARLFPEFKESPNWDRKAASFLYRQAREGFFRDGFHRERTTGARRVPSGPSPGRKGPGRARRSGARGPGSAPRHSCARRRGRRRRPWG